ncbi:hypothetical protein R6Q57_014862 [Mikania cordata]
MPIYTSSEVEESNNRNNLGRKLFGRERSLHAIFGGGSVADILLWRNKSLSASILLGFTIIWYLFEVVKYTFVSLVCHFLILFMLMIFITYTISKSTNRNFADTHERPIQYYVTRWLVRKLYHIIIRFYEISSGENLIEFLVVWMVPVRILPGKVGTGSGFSSSGSNFIENQEQPILTGNLGIVDDVSYWKLFQLVESVVL